MSFQKSFKALSDPTRRKILDLLKDGERSAGEISEHFEMTGATISHHLNTLKEAGLVLDRKSGKYIFYELNMSVLDEILAWMSDFRRE